MFLSSQFGIQVLQASIVYSLKGKVCSGENILLVKFDIVCRVCFRFLAENKSKKQAAEKEGSHDKEQSATEREKASKAGDHFSISAALFDDTKEDIPLPFFDAGEEEFLKCHGLKDRDNEEDGEVKSTVTARDMYGKWGDEQSYSTSYPSLKEKSRREADDTEALDNMEEELYRSRKHSKKEEKSKKKEKKEKEKTRRSASPPSTSRAKDRPLFPGAFPPSESPQRLSASREDFELRVGSVDERSGYVNPVHEILHQLVP